MPQTQPPTPTDAASQGGLHPAPLRGWAAVAHAIAFYPILLTFGPWTKLRAPRLQEPKGPREGVAGEGPNLRLLILGDSSAAGVGVSTQSQALSGQLVGQLAAWARVDWQLIARCGDTTAQATARIKAAHPRRADVAVTGLGVNDVIRGRRLSTWLDHQRALVGYLTDTVGVKHIYVSGMPPLSHFPRLTGPLRWALGHRAAQFDRALAALLSDHPAATHIPASMVLDATTLAEDGFHPGPQVYTDWAAAVAQAIAADLGS